MEHFRVSQTGSRLYLEGFPDAVKIIRVARARACVER
jgi:hypothetical protein